MKSKTRLLIFRIAGEAIIITASVLAALYVDEWQQEKDERKKAKDYLELLSKNLRADSITFSSTKKELLRFKDMYKTALSIGEKKNQLSTEEIVDAINGLVITTQAQLQSSTFELMKSGSNFSLITNDSLLQNIMHYYSETSVLDNCNSEMLRTFQANVDMLATSGFILADKRNLQLMIPLAMRKELLGLVRLRDLYCDVFLAELESRSRSCQNLLASISDELKV